MKRYDLLYRLYDEFDTDRLREYQDFVDLFPPVDSRVALEYWQDASDELAAHKEEIREAFADGDVLCEVAARTDRDGAFTALDLHSEYGRALNALVLDVDETLRSAGGTDNEIPRDTLHVLTEFHEAGVPIVICTGQTLENVKGFAIQGLGNELVHSGEVSIVYEAGTGVFTPGHGSNTKRLLYDDLDDDVVDTFEAIRGRVLTEAPADLRRGVHLQGNEFNVTLKPNFDIGSPQAEDVIDRGLVYLLDLLGEAVAARTNEIVDDPPGDAATDDCPASGAALARAYYADADPEIAGVLADRDAAPGLDADDVPPSAAALFDRIDVAYYHADAAEIGSRELNKVAGVGAALDVLDVSDPFVLVMGDSKSDLRVMEWAEETGSGVSAAPEHSSRNVLDHVGSTDDLVFTPGAAADVLRTMYAWRCLANVNDSGR